MLEEEKENILKLTASLKEKTDRKTANTLNLDMLERCVKRIIEFSDSCTECRNFFLETEKILKELEVNPNSINKALLENYKLNLKKIIVHLQKEHKLVKDGQYFELYLPLGIALGLPFGLAISNLALGFSIGLVIGSAVGSVLDASAKKKGQLI